MELELGIQDIAGLCYRRPDFSDEIGELCRRVGAGEIDYLFFRMLRSKDIKGVETEGGHGPAFKDFAYCFRNLVAVFSVIYESQGDMEMAMPMRLEAVLAESL